MFRAEMQQQENGRKYIQFLLVENVIGHGAWQKGTCVCVSVILYKLIEVLDEKHNGALMVQFIIS